MLVPEGMRYATHHEWRRTASVRLRQGFGGQPSPILHLSPGGASRSLGEGWWA